MTEFKVYWIPQVPMKPFEVCVPDVKTGRMICDVLADYDLFQFENNVKDDYTNAGGIAFCHPKITEGEWQDWPDDKSEEAGLIEEIAEADVGMLETPH